MGEITDEIRLEQLEWSRRRLEALDKIEAKLLEMRELARYATSRILSQKESAQVQEWVDILQAEVNAMDKETVIGNPLLTNISIWPMEAKQPIQ